MTDEFFGELTDEELDEVIGGSKDYEAVLRSMAAAFKRGRRF